METEVIKLDAKANLPLFVPPVVAGVDFGKPGEDVTVVVTENGKVIDDVPAFVATLEKEPPAPEIVIFKGYRMPPASATNTATGKLKRHYNPEYFKRGFKQRNASFDRPGVALVPGQKLVAGISKGKWRQLRRDEQAAVAKHQATLAEIAAVSNG